MATATITETLELPSGAVTDLTAARVRLRLVADSDGAPAPGYVTGDNATVVADKWTNPNSSGTYTFTGVRPNSGSSDDAITSPTGTVYQIAIFLKGQSAVHRYISVPDSAGPHQVADILTVAPDPLPTGQDLLDLIDAAGLDLTDLPNGVTADAVIGLDGGALVELTPAQVMATHTGDTVDAHDASAISYAGGTGMSATDVEAAIDELATEKADLTGAAFTGDVTVTGAAGGRVHIDVDASTDIAGVSLLGSGDTQPRAALTFSAFDVPALVMGPGGSSVVDTTLYRSAAGVVNANGGGFAGIGKGLVLTEQSAPSSPAANDITLYAADNGSGTTVLRTKDSAGTVTTLGSGGGGLTAEDVRDTIGTALVEGEAIDITVNDGADTITIAAEDATDANKGVVELATSAETVTGTDTARAVTPADLRSVVLPMRDTASGNLYFTPAGARASASVGSAAGVLLVVPIWLEARTYTSIGLYYYGTGTATLRLGAWNIAADGSPGTVALDAGTVTCTAGDGVVRKEATISWAPAAGWYWLGMLVDAYTSTPTMLAMWGAAGMQLLPGYRSGADSNNAQGLTRTGVTTGSLGTWGASGSSVSVAATAPMLYVRT